MTPDLDAIRQRLAKATTGPWDIDDQGGEGAQLLVVTPDDEIALLEAPEGSDAFRAAFMANNADLIAHAPTDLADLLAHIARQQARIAALEADIKALERLSLQRRASGGAGDRAHFR